MAWWWWYVVGFEIVVVVVLRLCVSFVIWQSIVVVVMEDVGCRNIRSLARLG